MPENLPPFLINLIGSIFTCIVIALIMSDAEFRATRGQMMPIPVTASGF